MIIFERFEAAKIKRFVSRYGKPYDVKRPDLNEYKEPTGDYYYLFTLFGVYHEASYKYLNDKISAAGVDVNEIEPMIVCMADENTSDIKVDDLIEVNGKDMIVTKVKDINNSGFAYDISLRWIDHGSESKA